MRDYSHVQDNGTQRNMIERIQRIRRVLARTGLVLAVLFAATATHAEEGAGLSVANASIGNTASLQRGARLYFNYCSGCHSIKYMSYSRLAQDLKLSNDQVLSSFAFTGARIGDQVIANMPADHAQEWFGKAPDRKGTRLNSSHITPSRMPSSA